MPQWVQDAAGVYELDDDEGDELLEFRIAGEVFKAYPDLSAGDSLTYFAKTQELEASTDDREQLALMQELLRYLLVPESADRFIARLNDRERPIGFRRLGQTIRFVREKQSGVPTMPEPASSPGSGSPDAGTSSTEDSSATESTSPASLVVAS